MEADPGAPTEGKPRGPEGWPPGLFEEIADLPADALVADTQDHPELYPGLWKLRGDGAGLVRIAAEIVCLVYHEARNVRHPLKTGALADKARYVKLGNLPTNKTEAWRAMAVVREHAASARRVREVVGLFERSYGLDLPELETLYEAPVWRSSAHGGNPWAAICSKARELIDAIEEDDHARRIELLDAIPKMRHNTGTIEAKLKALQSRQTP